MPKTHTASPASHEGPIGQYASDHILHAGNRALQDDSLGVKTRGDGNFAFHSDDVLFDQGAGRIDEASGVVATDIDDEILALEGMTVSVLGPKKGPRSSEPLDAAEAWLRANDPDYQK